MTRLGIPEQPYKAFQLGFSFFSHFQEGEVIIEASHLIPEGDAYKIRPDGELHVEVVDYVCVPKQHAQLIDGFNKAAVVVFDGHVVKTAMGEGNIDPVPLSFPEPANVVMDESHWSLDQLPAMVAWAQWAKETLERLGIPTSPPEIEPAQAVSEGEPNDDPNTPAQVTLAEYVKKWDIVLTKRQREWLLDEHAPKDSIPLNENNLTERQKQWLQEDDAPRDNETPCPYCGEKAPHRHTGDEEGEYQWKNGVSTTYQPKRPLGIGRPLGGGTTGRPTLLEQAMEDRRRLNGRKEDEEFGAGVDPYDDGLPQDVRVDC